MPSASGEGRTIQQRDAGDWPAVPGDVVREQSVRRYRSGHAADSPASTATPSETMMCSRAHHGRAASIGPSTLPLGAPRPPAPTTSTHFDAESAPPPRRMVRAESLRQLRPNKVELICRCSASSACRNRATCFTERTRFRAVLATFRCCHFVRRWRRREPGACGGRRGPETLLADPFWLALPAGRESTAAGKF